MNIGNKKSTKKRTLGLLLIAVFIALIAASAWGVLNYYRANVPRDTNSVDYSTRTDEDQKQADEKKEEIIRNEKEGASPSQEISVVINRFLQIPSSAIQLRSTLSGVQEGECIAAFTLGNQSFEKTFPTQYTGTYWACNIDLSSSDFAADGTWAVNLRVKSPSGGVSKPALSETRIER